MCGICGCDQGHNHDHDLEQGSTHKHKHKHKHKHEHNHNHSHAEHEARLIHLEQDVMAQNQGYADNNRNYFQTHNILACNLVASPGSGKTSLLVKTLQLIKAKYSIHVIEGDQQTDHDAEKIRATGVKALQINTGKVCHLDAHQISHAVTELDLPSRSLLFIENIGNLVCPAMFDLGESFRVVILSVTEGDDKPIKYPDMFVKSDLMIINKMDLLDYVDFNMEKCIAYAKQIKPDIEIIQLSAKTNENINTWLDWLDKHMTKRLAA